MDIKITKTSAPKPKPQEDTLGFGRYTTDHMFVMPYTTEKGWHDAAIIPYANFSLDPASMVFHYGQECFEGLKAYRTAEGQIQLFRPDKNAQRMAKTHQRLCIPQLPAGAFEEAVKALVSLEKDWVPHSQEATLYIRPCTIATEPQLGVKPSGSYLFFIICSPSGPYYSAGFNPIKIYVEDEYTRAAPGGMGEAKCGGNYAASLAGQQKAHQLGYSQVLWLDGVQRKFVEEVGSMNVFFKIDGVIRTAPICGTVLPGITRMSCIDLLKEWGYTVVEEAPSIDEVMAAAKQGTLEEVFGTGTAAVISPVGELRYKNDTATVANGQVGEITHRLYNTLTGIQWGRLPDPYGWAVSIP